MVIEDGPSGIRAAAAAGAGYIVGIYGDSSRELLEETGLCDELIPDYLGFHSTTTP
jgi:beta-phosphoglucomutase-like phosphatase (HAD superfamily)